MEKQWDVFISHAYEDKEKFVRPLAQALANLGVQVWYDEFTLKTGESISSSIDKGLINSRFGLVVISEAFLKKEWAKRELQGLVASQIAQRMVILPVWLGVSYEDVLEFSPPLADTVALNVGGMSADQVVINILRAVRPDIYEGYSLPILEGMVSGQALELAIPLSDHLKDHEMPPALTATGFKYPEPQWLTDRDRERLSELAKAAFVLLLFEQTESGCWGKSYLARHLARGDKLPLAHGALTGTPFALLAISSYAVEADSLVRESTYHLLFETLARLLREDGNFLKRESTAFGGTDDDLEKQRHAAGACLINLMYGMPGEGGLRTIEIICTEEKGSSSYDWATVSRALLQARHMNSIPMILRAKAERKLTELLGLLAAPMGTQASAHIWAKASDLHHDSINQWGTLWWVLPSLALPSVSIDLRLKLIDRLRQFLLAQSSAEPTGKQLLRTEVDASGNGRGKTVFGSGLALVAWRTLEFYELNDSKQSTTQSKRMVNRLISSMSDAIESPSLGERPQTLEGYLGWAAICLAASSVGIQISHEDCRAAVLLTQELNAEAVNNRADSELERVYKDLINNKRLLSPDLADSVGRIAARVAVYYEPVKAQKEKTAAQGF